MSSATESSSRPVDTGRERFTAGTIHRVILLPIRAMAFWLAVVLPIAIIASLVFGLATTNPVLVLVLLTVNVCCLVLGHDHTPYHP